MSPPPFPLFVNLAGRDVLVVGGGAMALLRGRQLADAGARLTVVAPDVLAELAALAAVVHLRPFAPRDLDGAWLAIAAATPAVNADVKRAADARRVIVNAIDDPRNASAYTAAIARRGDVAVAVSTGGRAPALAALVRDAVDALLPQDLGAWADEAQALRAEWKRAQVPLAKRRARLLAAMNERNGTPTATATATATETSTATSTATPTATTTTTSTSNSTTTSTSNSTTTSTSTTTTTATATATRRQGFVSLVGAGPGDPGLLTLRAAERLAEADLVLHDALVSGEALALAPRAHCFFVGKRAGRPSVRQETIHRIMIDAARLGKRVVRLKAGDPFVLGRGGEEALALEEAGVAHEVVPGLSSALAAPALAGIPVTHRGLATGFTVVSGHAEEAWRPALESLEPDAVTVVVLMGLAAREPIAAALRARGWDPATPAAICLAAGTEDAFTWTGTLRDLGHAPLPPGGAPGVLVIGAVAALGRPTLSPPLPLVAATRPLAAAAH